MEVSRSQISSREKKDWSGMISKTLHLIKMMTFLGRKPRVAKYGSSDDLLMCNRASKLREMKTRKPTSKSS